jgi:hypothetical protein
MLNSFGNYADIAAVPAPAHCCPRPILFRPERESGAGHDRLRKRPQLHFRLQHAFRRLAPYRVVEDFIKRAASTSGETRRLTILLAGTRKLSRIRSLATHNRRNNAGAST